MITILTDNNYIVHELFITGKEEQNFIENTPEWQINQFKWHGVKNEYELKYFTFYNEDQIQKINKVYKDFKPVMTIQRYNKLIENLPIEIIKKYFNFDDVNKMLCRYINTQDVFVWDKKITKNIKEIANIPLKNKVKITLEDYQYAVTNLYESLKDQGYNKKSVSVDYDNEEIQHIAIDVINNLKEYYQDYDYKIYRTKDNELIADDIIDLIYPLASGWCDIYNYVVDNIPSYYKK